jgi:hypothetical protein
MFSFRTEVEYHLATDHGPADLRQPTASTADDANTDSRVDEPVVATARAGT